VKNCPVSALEKSIFRSVIGILNRGWLLNLSHKPPEFHMGGREFSITKVVTVQESTRFSCAGTVRVYFWVLFYSLNFLVKICGALLSYISDIQSFIGREVLPCSSILRI
jgi:hypothetical protein